MLGISHLRLPVSQLERSRRFYQAAVGFQPVAEGAGETLPEADGPCAVLDALGIRLCLSETAAGFEPLELAFQTARLRAVVERLVGAEAILERPPAKTSRGTFEALLRDPDGHRLRLWRRLREDELEKAPDLPITRPWDGDARALLIDLLRQTPVLFRDLARANCVREAEVLAAAGGTVDRRTAARALIRATPRLMRSRLRRPLEEHGFDPGDFADDFAI